MYNKSLQHKESKFKKRIMAFNKNIAFSPKIETLCIPITRTRRPKEQKRSLVGKWTVRPEEDGINFVT